LRSPSRTRKLHKRLHTHRTFNNEQVGLNEKAPTCGAFAEPSDGLEPSTPSIPWRCSAQARRASERRRPRAGAAASSASGAASRRLGFHRVARSLGATGNEIDRDQPSRAAGAKLLFVGTSDSSRVRNTRFAALLPRSAPPTARARRQGRTAYDRAGST